MDVAARTAPASLTSTRVATPTGRAESVLSAWATVVEVPLESFVLPTVVSFHSLLRLSFYAAGNQTVQQVGKRYYM